jgi:hypothetical protein
MVALELAAPRYFDYRLTRIISKAKPKVPLFDVCSNPEYYRDKLNRVGLAVLLVIHFIVIFVI